MILTTPSQVPDWLARGYIVVDDTIEGNFGEQLVSMEKPCGKDG